jgi:hypothetical protein
LLKSEVTKLLTMVGAVEGFTPDAASVELWHGFLADVEAEDAFAATKAHLSDSTQRTKPAHILAAVKKRKLRRINAGQEWRMNQ